MALPLLLSFLGSGMAQAGVLGAAGSFLANPLVAGAIGSGLGTALETGDMKRGLVGGLGAFAGGKALGSLMGGGAGGAAGSTAGSGAGSAAGPVAGAVAAPAAPAPSGLAGIAQGGMGFMGSPQGMGVALGGMLAPSALGMGGGQGGGSSAQRPTPMQAPAMQRTAATPPTGYQPGVSGEFNYGVSDPYTTDYVTKYASPMARGGRVTRMIPRMGAVHMAAGGIADVAAPAPDPNDKEIIAAAISAISGQHPEPQVALAMFLQKFGEAALRDLVDRVKSGEMGATAAKGEGKLEGPGDGMSDMIPASVQGAQDVLLSDGEYVVPADVVSGLGNGSSDAGAKELDNMLDRVRSERTGTTKQAPAIAKDKVVPA